MAGSINDLSPDAAFTDEDFDTDEVNAREPLSAKEKEKRKKARKAKKQAQRKNRKR